jgi:hypothetical protein
MPDAGFPHEQKRVARKTERIWHPDFLFSWMPASAGMTKDNGLKNPSDGKVQQ